MDNQAGTPNVGGNAGGLGAPEIVGDWSYGRDNTDARIGMARTPNPSLFAVHNTADSDGLVIRGTRKQLLDFARGIVDGQFGHLIDN